MDAGEVVLLARATNDIIRLHANELGLHTSGQGKRITLHLVDRNQDGQPLATVDRQLTNRLRLPQNQRGAQNAAGQLQTAVAAGLAELRVLSVTATDERGVWAVRAAVRLLPAAFSLVVPELASRAAASLDEQAAAAVANAAIARALIDVVEMLETTDADVDSAAGRHGRGPTSNGGNNALMVEDVDPTEPSTSTGVRKRTSAAPALTAANGLGSGDDWGLHSGGEARAEGELDDDEGGPGEEFGDVRDEVFSIVAPRDWSTAHPDPPGLKCKLFPYQQRGLSWMVWRETQPELGPDQEPPAAAPGFIKSGAPWPATEAGVDAASTNPQPRSTGDMTDAAAVAEAATPEAAATVAAAAAAAASHLGDFASQDLFWRRVEVCGGRGELWVNPYPGGGLRREPPPPPQRQRVGILADEMGLGKTVEVIALMLARPPPQPQQEREQGQPGPAGLEKRKGKSRDEEAGAANEGPGVRGGGGGAGHAGRVKPRGPNLIVTPPSILQQWSHEIANHSNLKVRVYDGLRLHRQQSEEKEKQLIKEAKKQARMDAAREKLAKRQQREEERRQARLRKEQAREARKRAREEREARARGRAGKRTATRRAANGFGSHSNGADDTEEDEFDSEGRGGADHGRMGVGNPGLGSVAQPAAAVAIDAVGAGTSDGMAVPGGSEPEPWPAPSLPLQLPRPPAENGVAGGLWRTTERVARGASASDDDVLDDSDDDSDEDFQPHGGDSSGRRAGRGPGGNGVDGYAEAGTSSGRGMGRGGGRIRIRVVRGRGSAAGRGGTSAANGPCGGSIGGLAGANGLHNSAGAGASGAGAGSGAGGPLGSPSARVAVPSRMEIYHRELMVALYAGTALCPASCDPELEAAMAVAELLDADVVLTTYSVLKEEVHYSPSNRVLSGLRHEKKYSVPESPLLQVHWHRLVLDEAQMVGGSFSNVALMAARIEATHRWCVTGTPIGPGGLSDILGLLRVLQYTPYDDEAVFKDLITRPYQSGSADGHSRLATLLKPIMWRNSKVVAAQDHPLPARKLQVAHLRFSAPEETFYDVIKGETRKAYNELTSYQHRQQQERLHRENHQPEQHAAQKPGPSQAQRAQHTEHGTAAGQSAAADEVIDLTQEVDRSAGEPAGTGDAAGGAGGEADGQDGAALASPSKARGGRVNRGVAAAKRRREEARGEELALVAREALQQMRLACVHVRLTRFWQKLSTELGLGGGVGAGHGHGHGHHHHGGQQGRAGGAAPLPAIDDVMARLRDQAQLHLQNHERDLCMALNALAARLEATMRKVKAMAIKRAKKEAASAAAACAANGTPAGRSGAGRSTGGRGAAAPGAGGAASSESDEEGDAGGRKPAGRKKARRTEVTGLKKNAALFGISIVYDEDEEEEAGVAAGAAGAAEDGGAAVSAFRYSGRDKSAADLSADAERMLRECRELLERSWRVGENGIEAAAAAEDAATAAAAAAGGGEMDSVDIKAAAASIRSWRFVQAHTSQLLADLLSTYPQVMAAAPGPAGAAAGAPGAGAPPPPTSGAAAGDAADASPALPGASASGNAVPADTGSAAGGPSVPAPAAPAPALDESTAAAAALRASELRAYVASRVTDVRSTADREEQKARERVARVKSNIDRLEKQIVEEYRKAVLLGLSSSLVMEPRAWLEDLSGRLEIARKTEAEEREKQQAIAAAGATLALMGKEVAAVLSAEEAHVNKQRVGLEAVAGSLLVEDAVERLRAAARGLRSCQMDQGPDWQGVLVGGILVYLPPEGSSGLGLHADDRLKARAQWCLSYAPAVGALRRAVWGYTEPEPAEQMARGIAHAFDLMTVILVERHLRQPTRMLEARALDQHKIAENHKTYKLRDRGLPMLLSALEAVRLRIELLRTWKEHNTAELQLEIAAHDCEAVTADVTAAAHGQVPGFPPLLRLSEEDLRDRVDELKNKCEDLRSKKAFYHNQYLDASSRRSGRSAPPRQQTRQPTGAAGASGGASASEAGPSRSHGSSPDPSGAKAAETVMMSRDTDAWASMELQAAIAGTSAGCVPAASRPPGLGVAGRTGILACLHQWTQWRRGYDPRMYGSLGGHGYGGSGPGTHRAEVMDLTAADQEEGRELRQPPQKAVGGVQEHAPLANGFASGSDPRVSVGASGGAATAGVQAEAEVEPMQSERDCSGSHALRDAGTGPDRTGLPLVQGDGATAAAAAAAAARARIAAAMAAAQAKLGVGPEAANEDDEEGLVCAVCRDPLTSNIRLFPCGHYYCADCSGTILGASGDRRCPTCRVYVADKDAVQTVAAVKAGAAGGGSRKAGAAVLYGSNEVDPPEGREILSVRVQCADELMCKIGALVRRLLWLKQNRPAEKSLVFSQWADALQIVESGLRANGIGYVTLESGRKMRAAMKAFLDDDSCRVFLLRMRQGAAGLTLVRANHVFLLEPSLDPAIEQQAVARVHRIGQTREVTVTRLLVDGTVEEAVMRMLKAKQQLFMEAAAGPSGSSPHGLRAPGAAGPSMPAGGGPRSRGVLLGPGPVTGAAGAGATAVTLAPIAVPLLEGGEGEEASSLPAAAPKQEVVTGADMSYLLDAVLL